MPHACTERSEYTHEVTAYAALPADLLREISDAGLDPEAIYRDIVRALEEDLPDGSDDTTSAATISDDAQGGADWAAREPGVVAGLAIAAMVFRCVMGDDVEITGRVADGTRVAEGDVVMRVAGPTRGLLTAERTALNFACHLSGVATATSHWVEALEGTTAKVLDTRKTLPGWRALQKYAVRCGGGVNHRFSLADMAMVKDNHVIAAGGVVPALEAVRAAYPDLPIEVEVTDLDQLRELLDAGCDRILLDNMSTAMMAEAVAINAGRAVLEASGGLTIERAREVGETGVDYISVGALTHSVKVFDIGMDLRGRGMTLLAADIGNSDTVLGLLDGEEVVAHWRVSTDERRTSDEWAVLVRGLLADAGRSVDAIAVCSTVPAVLHEWRDMLGTAFRGHSQCCRRARCAHRRAGPDGQSARGRRGPDHQCPRRCQ